MYWCRHLIFLITALFAADIAFSQSVLATGEWYKFAIYNEGVYKLTYSNLQEAGLDVQNVDPQKFRLYGNAGGMLPQKNSDPRPFDLKENSIVVVGGEDGKFDSQDYILFFGHGPDSYRYDTEKKLFSYEQNKYDTTNYYFLTISDKEGKRISDLADLGHEHALIDSYTDFYFLEKEDFNLLHSGREWWGRLGADDNIIINTPFKELYSDGYTKAYVEVMSQSTVPAEYKVFINNTEIGSIGVDSILNYNNSGHYYTTRGKENSSTFELSNSSISDGIKLKLQYIKNGGEISRGYYNKILIQTERKLRYNGEPLISHTPRSTTQALVTVKIAGANQNLQLWDISEPYNPKQQEFYLKGTSLLFGTIGGEIKKYTLFDPGNLPSPVSQGKVDNQDIKSLPASDLLIIGHPDFMNESRRLADFRSAHNGYDVSVVSTKMIFNEFSSGRQDVSAIRDFIRHMYKNDNQKLKYVLLIGRGSYDYLNSVNDNTNYIPIYQSHNSLHPVFTYSSDDYYGFLKEEAGEWSENFAGDHILDVSVGRLPVVNTDELKNIIDKLIWYSTSKETLGNWRNKILFVADDGDLNIYQRQSEDLSVFADTSFRHFEYNKIYLGAYDQANVSTVEKSPEARKAIEEAVGKGALMVNYIGHGGYQQWADEEILTKDIVENFNNKSKLPLFITATCEFGRHDDPMYRSGGEKLLTNPEGGGIGIVTTSRPVYSSNNYELNKAFFRAVDENLSTPVLGDIFKDTKNNSLEGAGNRNFILLGDPSMSLSIPGNKIVLDELANDTLKALQEVTINGFIKDESGNTLSDFNGEVEVTVYDKPITYSTKEKGSPYFYKDRTSIIFRGKATVSQGMFTSTFIVPLDIQHRVGDGKMFFYAKENSGLRDAANGMKVKIGGSMTPPFPDNKGPEIKTFLEDSTFQAGDVVGSSTLLIAHFSDKSGINLSGQSFDGDIKVSIDGAADFILNEYYWSTIDDFTSGTLVYPIEGLSDGKHSLTLTASDIYNNPSSVELTFVVENDQQFVINELRNYPNPAISHTTFEFMHNRAGEPLEGNLTIFNNRGEKVLYFDFETPAGQVRHKIFDWNCKSVNQSKIGEGIYFYKISVRSKSDGARAERIEKLIILN